MYTQCSSCATLFRVTPRHLREAHGRVRCCLCHETFDALASLTDTLPPGLPQEELSKATPPPRPTRVAPVVAVDDEPEEVLANEPTSEAPAVAEVPPSRGREKRARERDLFVELDFTPPVIAEPEPPSDARPHRRTGATVGWTAGILLLLLLLVGQVGYLKRDDLAQYPRMRPWLEAMCWVAKCELPLLSDLDQVHILQRRVAAHPDVRGALLVKAILVNEASFPQPYPRLRLIFKQPNGVSLAARSFTPAEYLEDAGLRAGMTGGMPPKQPVAVRLELADLGAGAADNYQIELE